MSSGIRILVDPGKYATSGTNAAVHAIDIVAIHGIGAHPDRTWTGRGHDNEEVNWLTHRDMLPKAAPTARIMRFGYKSNWFGTENDEPKKTHVSDVAEVLLKDLEFHRRNTTRPIIFIAHSYGGLVLMQALRRSFDNPDKWSNIFSFTAGIIFFGTPFRGRKGLSLQQIVNAVTEYSPGFEVYDETMSLSVDENPYLQDIVKRYTETRRVDHPVPVCCFYETLASPIKKVLRNENLSDGYLIPEGSACLDVSKGVERHPLERHHYNLQKFANPAESGYRAVEDVVVRLANGARKYLEDKLSASKPSRHWMVPFGRNEHFVGREDILQRLLRRLPPSLKKDDCQHTVLHGLGGIGKTQIALEAAFRIWDNHADCSVFWVPVVNATTFENAYRDIGRRIGVAGIEHPRADVKNLVKQALGRESSGEWLLIIDNIDDTDVFFGQTGLCSYLPSSRTGSILFTTRNLQVGMSLDIPKRDTLCVIGMLREDSTRLLQQSLKESQIRDGQATSALLDLLADLPLAVKQASATMFQTGMTSRRYLEHCQSSDQAMIKLLSQDFQDKGRYRSARNAIASTWLVSFEQVSRTPLALLYLKWSSLLGETAVPKALLPPVPQTDELDVDEAIGVLKAYGFITFLGQNGTFGLHRLVRLVMRDWLVKNREHQECATEVLDHVGQAYPPAIHRNKHIWTTYLPHAQAILNSGVSVTQPNLLAKVGWSLETLGKYREAHQVYRKEYDVRQQTLGWRHPDTLRTRFDIARTLQLDGKYNECASILQDSLHLSKLALGQRHPQTLQCMGDLFEVYTSLEMHVDSRMLAQQLFGAYFKHSDYDCTVNTTHALASVIWDLGQYDMAREAYTSAYIVQVQYWGQEHPLSLDSMRKLAVLQMSMGNLKEAEKLLLEYRGVANKIYGREHPITSTGLASLARVLYLQHRHDEAEMLARESFNLHIEAHGRENARTLDVMVTLVDILHCQGARAECTRLAQECLRLQMLVLGSHRSQTQMMHNKLLSWAWTGNVGVNSVA